MKKLFNLFFLLPIAIIIIMLSVANRQMVRFSLDPLNSESPAFYVDQPLFVFLFVAVLAGMCIGSSLTWWLQGKHRKALREKSYEADQLRREKEAATKVAQEQQAEIAPGLPLVTNSR